VSSTPFDRRAFLRRAGITGAAAVMAAGLPRPPARADESLAPFLHGVASGDPTPDRVILWTRVTPPNLSAAADIKVTWVIARDPDLTDVVATGTTTAVRDRDWTVRVDASGLDPFTYYFYGFRALGASSLTGRTKTAPAPGQDGADHLRFGLVSCSSFQHGYFNAYARVAERDDLDLVIHLGDYVYEYAPGEYGNAEVAGERDHEPPVEMVTLDEYRARYAQYRLDPDLRRLHQLFPFVTTWDDHESTDNSWRDGALNHNPDDPDWPNEAGVPWEVRKADSQRAYDEWMPIRSTGDPNIIYRQLSYGDLADLIVLDTRLEGRDEQVKIAPGQEALFSTILFQETSDPDRHLISPEQMAWFQERLSSSTARWKLVAQQVVVGQWNVGGLPMFDETLPDAPQLIRDGGNAINPDAWDGYVADRNRFLDHLRDNAIDNVVVLTGDVHSSWAMDLTRDPYDVTTYDPVTGGSVAVEVVVPSVTSASLAGLFGPGAEAEPAMIAGLMAQNPHMRFIDMVEHGYVILDVTPERAQADWYATPEILQPDNQEFHMASWGTDDGANRLTEGQPTAAKDPAPALPAGDPPAGRPGGAGGAHGPSLPATGGGLAVAGLAAMAAAGAIRLRTRQSPDLL
jgi:alkaline phosphatase D